jgi:hypothetical protein
MSAAQVQSAVWQPMSSPKKEAGSEGVLPRFPCVMGRLVESSPTQPATMQQSLFDVERR